MGCTWRRARHKRHYGQCIDIAFAPLHSRAQPAQSLPTRCAGQRGGTMAIRCRSQCQAPQRQRQAVNKLNARIIQRTAKAKKASPLPLPRSRSRDSQLQQIETNASATTAQLTTIPSSGWESNEVRRRSAQVHPIRGNMGRATAPIRRITTNPIPTRTPISKL